MTQITRYPPRDDDVNCSFTDDDLTYENAVV